MITGSLVATRNAALGTALALAAALSASLDVAGALHLGRRLTGRRASQNVESREAAGHAGVLILAAGYDSPRPGARMPLRDPWAALIAAILAVLVCCGLRLAGIDGTVLAAAQFVPTVALVLLLAPLLAPELARPGRDPAGAAAVAVVLRLAEELRGRLERFDLWVVLTGASRPCGLGMRRWLRRRRRELEGRRAVVLSVGPIGDGPLRYAAREGPVVPRRSDGQLLRICEEIAQDDRDGAYGAAAVVKRSAGDGFAALARGVPALSVWCEGDDAGDVERVKGFCRELVTRVDSDVKPA